LRQLWEARERSQVEMSEKLDIKQAAVSRLERCTDIYLNALRSCIEAMGGELEVIARFSNRAVRIRQFEELDAESQPRGLKGNLGGTPVSLAVTIAADHQGRGFSPRASAPAASSLSITPPT
jgi:hypothetical protein